VSNLQASASTRLFQDSAEQLAVRLEQETTEVARALAAEARGLVAQFTDWQTERPADDVRVATIQRLFDLNRRAMDYLAG
jgi:hypothetical protein